MHGRNSKRAPMLGVAVAALAVVLGGCADLVTSDVRQRVRDYTDASPALTAFHYCYGYGCARRVTLSLSPEDWSRITRPLQAPARDAASERLSLARAAAAFERVTGRLAGTDGDLGGTFTGMARDGQLDCIDETANMVQFLRLLEGAGLLRRHTVGPVERRGNLIDAWPHVTATLTEKATGDRFAIDSWYRDHGVPPIVVSLADWRVGIEPQVACLAAADDGEIAPQSPACRP